MAVYIASLGAEGKTPATISVLVAAVKWYFATILDEDKHWQTTENKLWSIHRDSILTKGGVIF